jgi:hypothetical protein
MRRVLCSLAATFALTGCVSTGYYYDEGSADYYYERDSGYAYGGYTGFYGGGFYDPFWSPHFFYGANWSPYSYGAWYGGSAWAYSPWYYDSWWGSNHNDYYWWQQQRLRDAAQRRENVDNERARLASMGRAPVRDGGALRDRADGSGGLDQRARRAAPDDARQVRTGTVDPYYGTPRIPRGQGLPQRTEPQLGVRERPQRGEFGSRGPAPDFQPGSSGRAARAPQPGMNFGERPVRGPAPGSAPARSYEPAPAPIRAPTPSFERSAPSFTPRSAPSSAPSRDSGRGERR